MYRAPYSRICAAATDVLIQRSVDVDIGRVRPGFQQGAGCEQHASLAIAALRDVFLDPGALERVTPVVRKPLDRGESLSRRVRRCDLAGSNCAVALEHAARTASADSASVLRAGEPELIPQYPEERRVAFNIYRTATPVYNYRYLGHVGPFATDLNYAALRGPMSATGKEYVGNADGFDLTSADSSQPRLA